jgi:hypothetical protein
MAMKRLHFGVGDPIPYTYGGAFRTTVDVAKILEAKYGIMEAFAKDNEKEIRQILRDQSKRYVGQTMRGVEPDLQPAFEKIRRMFKNYILTKKLDGRVKGVPTAASLRGVNHRFKRPFARRAARASFWDTGLYVSAFKTWVA